MKSTLPLKDISNFLKIDATDEIVNRKQFVSDKIDLLPDEERVCTALISNTEVDSDGDILYSPGVDLTRFYKNPVVVFNHQYSIPNIGKVLDIRVVDGGIIAKMRFATTQFANEIWELIKGGFLRTCSIGFIPLEVLMAGTAKFNQFAKEKNLNIEGCKRIVTRFMLIENSIVPLPANQDALILAVASKSLTLEDSLKKQLGIEVIEVKEEVLKTEKTVEVDTAKESAVVKVEEVVKEAVVEAIVEKPVEVIEEPKPLWNVVRQGDYQISEEDKKVSKALKLGKIL